MKQMLREINEGRLHWHNNGKRIDGPNEHMRGAPTGLWGDCTGLWGDCADLRGECTDLSGDCTDLWGDCSGMWGECTDMWGNCTGLWGNCTGLWGECTDVWGDLDACDLSDKDRADRVEIKCLIGGCMTKDEIQEKEQMKRYQKNMMLLSGGYTDMSGDCTDIWYGCTGLSGDCTFRRKDEIQEEEQQKRYQKKWSGNTRRKLDASLDTIMENMVLLSVAICGGIAAVILIVVIVDVIKTGLHRFFG